MSRFISLFLVFVISAASYAALSPNVQIVLGPSSGKRLMLKRIVLRGVR